MTADAEKAAAALAGRYTWLSLGRFREASEALLGSPLAEAAHFLPATVATSLGTCGGTTSSADVITAMAVEVQAFSGALSAAQEYLTSGTLVLKEDGTPLTQKSTHHNQMPN